MTAVSANQSLLCRVHSVLCAVPLPHVIETMRPLAVEPIVSSPRFVLGLSIIRGEPIVVVDAGRLLSDQPSVVTRFVTIRMGERRVALAVDAVVGVRSFGGASMGALPALLRDAGNEVIESIGSLDTEFLMMLRSTRLVSNDMQQTLGRGEPGGVG